MFWQRFSFPFSMWITGLFCDVCTDVSTCVGKWCVLCVFRFCLHLSPSPPMSFNSWLCMSCHSWNRRTSSRQPRHVDTGASWQKTTCCGGRNARKRVSLNFKQRQSLSRNCLRLQSQSCGCARLECALTWKQKKTWACLFTHSASMSLLTGIDEPLPLKKRKIVKPGFTHSPWKSAYIRQHRIDTNWRRGDLKSPKVVFPSDQCFQPWGRATPGVAWDV